MRVTTVIWLAALGLALAGLFQIKHEVQKLEHTLAEVRKKNTVINEDIRLLSAEWHLLNQPDRLAGLGERLKLAPVANTQLSDFNRLPARFEATNQAPETTLGRPKAGATRARPRLRPSRTPARTPARGQR